MALFELRPLVHPVEVDFAQNHHKLNGFYTFAPVSRSHSNRGEICPYAKAAAGRFRKTQKMTKQTHFPARRLRMVNYTEFFQFKHGKVTSFLRGAVHLQTAGGPSCRRRFESITFVVFVYVGMKIRRRKKSTIAGTRPSPGSTGGRATQPGIQSGRRGETVS